MKGVYIVFMRLRETAKIEVGALGSIKFLPGIYAYAGSAMNSVESRLARHYSSTEKKHWHIDYLSDEANVFDHFILPDESRYECVLAMILEKMGEPVEDFGASDCECNSHLYRIEKDLEAGDQE